MLRLFLAVFCLFAGRGLAAPLSDGVNPWQERDLSHDEVEPALRRGADFLLRTELASGQFVYRQDPLGHLTTDNNDRYSLIRHLGTVYALLKAYGATDDQRYLEGATRALSYAQRFAVDSPQGPVLKGLGGLSLGENGFFLVNTALIAKLLHRTVLPKLSAGAAHWIAANLQVHGPFATPEQWGESQAVIGLVEYASSETTGLTTTDRHDFLQVAHLWLTGAMADDRPSHWSVQAIAAYVLAPGTKPDAQLQLYGLSSAHDLMKDVITKPTADADGAKETAENPAPTPNSRLIGSRGGKLYSCNASARAEGLLAAQNLARYLGNQADVAYFFGRVREHLAFALQFQYGTEGSFPMQNPTLKRVGKLFDLDGAVMDDAASGAVRIDYASHLVRALSTYLAMPQVPPGVGVTMADWL